MRRATRRRARGGGGGRGPAGVGGGAGGGAGGGRAGGRRRGKNSQCGAWAAAASAQPSQAGKLAIPTVSDPKISRDIPLPPRSQDPPHPWVDRNSREGTAPEASA